MKANSDTPAKLYIGLDVHKAQTTVAIAKPGARGEVRVPGNVRTTQHALEGVLRRIAKAHGCSLPDLEVCYEAGGCGMWIARRLLQLKVRCTVVAPSLIPQKTGDKVKTDSRAERDRLPGGQPEGRQRRLPSTRTPGSWPACCAPGS